MKSATIVIKDIDDYISVQPENIRPSLEQIRQTIRKAAPGAEEVISYQMPAYKYQGILVYFAAFKNHIGFYPTAGGIEAFKKELSGYQTSKGTIQFPNDKPIPLKLITQIVKFRVLENEEKTQAKKKTNPVVKKPKSNRSSVEEQVNEWMSKLKPKVKTEIDAVRKIINAASSKLNERIKWNAPSYYYKDDIVTFGPYKPGRLLLIFHHPLIIKIKSPLLEGNYRDRRIVCLKDLKAIKANKKELERIIKEHLQLMDK
ncbi:MAG: DUF1801 domain-containing protein [Sphingobacteriales bacterium]